jgi:DNA-binding MarR family transcriptional regulator
MNMSEMNPLQITEHLHGYGTGAEHATELILKNKDQNQSEFYLISLAEKIEDLHQIKKRNLGDELSKLGEPIWKIMLRLFITTNLEKSITVADISQQISFPETTVLRYIKILDNIGYIKQLQMPEQRSSGLQLTRQGQAIMRNTLLALNAC